MLGDSYTTVGWPACGEIDIMEMVGSNYGGLGNKTVYGTAHWDNNGQHAQFGGSNQVNSLNLSDEFHVYSIIWDSNSIKWYRDDILYHQIDITPAGLSEFHQPFFLIFNVAVGGNWPGSPNSNTQFPQKMIVDYVRVFQ
jgi:beta-glucanase (GH16 family)